MKTNSSSLERINPYQLQADEVTGNQSYAMHLARYEYAGKYLVPGTVADIACGVGYGSHLLATGYGEPITHIVSVDLEEDAIEFARMHYTHDKIHFMVADAMSYFAPWPLNNVVSLETIEHLPQPALFIQQLSAQLVRGGRFIASVPVTPSMDANPYHLHDFTVRSFRKMFTDAGLREIDSFIQVQRYNPFVMAQRKEERTKGLRKNLLDYYRQHPKKLWLRLKSVLTDGFANKYMVAVFEKL